VQIHEFPLIVARASTSPQRLSSVPPTAHPRSNGIDEPLVLLERHQGFIDASRER